MPTISKDFRQDSTPFGWLLPPGWSPIFQGWSPTFFSDISQYCMIWQIDTDDSNRQECPPSIELLYNQRARTPLDPSYCVSMHVFLHGQEAVIRNASSFLHSAKIISSAKQGKTYEWYQSAFFINDKFVCSKMFLKYLRKHRLQSQHSTWCTE